MTARAAVDEFRSPRPIAGWRVVAVSFWMAVFAWGLGFYSLSLYVHHLEAAGWPVALLSGATTGYFLLGAAAIAPVERAAAAFGRRRVAIAGALLLAGGVAVLPHARGAPTLLAAYAAMALGWAATSGTAITQVIGRWFDARRGLALNLALTGASASGFLVIPPMAWAIERWGLVDGLAIVAVVLVVATVVAVATNLPEPGEAAGAARAPDARAGSAPVGSTASVPAVPEPLVRVVALFAIGWLAQVAFLSQQVPLLAPKVGAATATAAVAATTAASLAGRLAVAGFVDRLDHRLVTATSFGLQAAGMALLLASDAPAAVLAGCVLFGLSVGNVVTLPAVFAQREFAPARYGEVVARVWTVGQTLFALGPIGAGALIAATGTPAWTIAACLAMQVAAAALCFSASAAAPHPSRRTASRRRG
jgi:MFS family permease